MRALFAGEKREEKKAFLHWREATYTNYAGQQSRPGQSAVSPGSLIKACTVKREQPKEISTRELYRL